MFDRLGLSLPAGRSGVKVRERRPAFTHGPSLVCLGAAEPPLASSAEPCNHAHVLRAQASAAPEAAPWPNSRRKVAAASQVPHPR